ncbi:MAG: hypothetical protein PHR25_01235 [Clostridia bacterium]|nr:hypothetical protein [Clostridia bacterium]MDD4375390.1 hypothetical protein [Clostridia bacterium]
MEKIYSIKKTATIISLIICIGSILTFGILSIIGELKYAIIYISLFGGWAAITIIKNLKQTLNGKFILYKDRLYMCYTVDREIEFKNVISIKYLNFLIYECVIITELNNKIPIIIDISVNNRKDLYKHLIENCKEYENIKISKKLLNKIDKIKF